MRKQNSILKSLISITFIPVFGLLLQRFEPPIPIESLQWPVNAIALSLFTLSLFFLQKSEWLTSTTALITACAFMTLEVIALGIFPQTHLQNVVNPSLWGLNSILFSWHWFFLQVFLLLTLGVHVTKQITTKGYTPLFMLQLGVYTVLSGAQLGYPDIEQCWVTMAEGNRADIAYDKEDKVVDLGFSISLQDFAMEEYAPKIFLVSPATQGSSPQKTEIKKTCHAGQIETLEGYLISVERYIPFAHKQGNSFYPSDSGFSVHAAFVTVQKESKLYSGWISSGNTRIQPHGLFLEDSVALFMDKPKPKSYTSTILVKDTVSLLDTLSVQVNKPVKAKGWKIYQIGYDKEQGRDSSISVLKLIRDPWLPFVYGGIFLIIAGALRYLFSAERKEKK